LGDHIKKRRLDLGLFQKQLAQQLGVDEETIFRWEGDESRPQIRLIPAIIKLLGYNPFSFPERLPEKLTFYRQIFGLSQKKLARKIGVDAKTLGLWERGKREISKNLVKAVERFLKIYR